MYNPSPPDSQCHKAGLPAPQSGSHGVSQVSVSGGQRSPELALLISSWGHTLAFGVKKERAGPEPRSHPAPEG